MHDPAPPPKSRTQSSALHGRAGQRPEAPTRELLRRRPGRAFVRVRACARGARAQPSDEAPPDEAARARREEGSCGSVSRGVVII